MDKERNIDRHPAYGLLMFSHIHGGNPNLFGSSVRHDDRIKMKISHAHAARRLNEDRYCDDEAVCQVEMSLTQFAEAISSMNICPGVPVTITYTEKDGYIPGIEKITDKRIQFLNEFKEKNDESVKMIKELIESVRTLFEKKSLNKKDREDILSMLMQVENATGSHNTFMTKQFNETADNIVKEAKGEVEAFVQYKMNSLALMALAQERSDLNTAGESLVDTLREGEEQKIGSENGDQR